jgi:hypothetical protein
MNACAPHPAATGGGFGFGKFRWDDQPSLCYGSAEQGCLVQKFVAAPRGLAEEALAQVKCPNYPGVHDFWLSRN